MGWGLYQAYGAVMTGTAQSCTINLTRGFTKVNLKVPSMVSGSAFDVYVAASSTGTYYQLMHPPAQTATVLGMSFIVAASGCTNGMMVPIPAGFQFYKIIATTSTPTANLSFEFVVSD